MPEIAWYKSTDGEWEPFQVQTDDGEWHDLEVIPTREFTLELADFNAALQPSPRWI